MTPRQQHIADLNKLTIKYGSVFLSILRKDYLTIAKQIEQAKDVNIPIELNQRKYAYNLYKLYLTIGIDKAIEGHNALVRRKSEQDEMIYHWLLFLRGYADRTLAERVTKIPQTTKDELSKIIERGLADGLGYRDIAKNIREESSVEFNKYRSLLIARTEGNNAVNAGAFVAAQASGLIMEKRWLHAGHTKRENRPEHVRLWRATEEKPLALNDYFIVNGKAMLFPGDPAGGASENVNCRCIGQYRPKRDANDNVIAINQRATQVTNIQRAVRTALIDNMLRQMFGDVVESVIALVR